MVLTDLISGALKMYNIRIIIKLNSITYQVEPNKVQWYNPFNRT